MNPNQSVTDRGSQVLPIPIRDPQAQLNRINVSWITSTNVRHLIERLIGVAKQGLPQMYSDGGFIQTLRGVQSKSGPSLQLEGRNLRYSAIVALGASCLDIEGQREILGLQTAAEFAQTIVEQAENNEDLGAIALTAWAAAEIAGYNAASIFERLRSLFADNVVISTVECSWVLTAALAARHIADTEELCSLAAGRLRAAQRQSGLFPHMLPSSAGGQLRSHVGSFADQVYPIQALARLSSAADDKAALEAANACASKICHHQGFSGQWWWHYDIRTGDIVEGYPVYSVHQHAMGPMALFELLEAGGSDYRPQIVKGLKWFEERPEVNVDLISEEHGVIWRKIGRREPAKAMRSISAVTTAMSPGVHIPGLSRIFPPREIDHECRPYELGWLLYAWMSGGIVKKQSPGWLG